MAAPPDRRRGGGGAGRRGQSGIENYVTGLGCVQRLYPNAAARAGRGGCTRTEAIGHVRRCKALPPPGGHWNQQRGRRLVPGPRRATRTWRVIARRQRGGGQRPARTRPRPRPRPCRDECARLGGPKQESWTSRKRMPPDSCMEGSAEGPRRVASYGAPRTSGRSSKGRKLC